MKNLLWKKVVSKTGMRGRVVKQNGRSCLVHHNKGWTRTDVGNLTVDAKWAAAVERDG